jgi:Bacterial archaeo-eukaryotic release factor family 10
MEASKEGAKAMMSRTEIDKLLSIRAAEPRVLSLFLPVPLDPAELRSLPAKADGLLASAARGSQEGHGTAPEAIGVPGAERQRVRDLLDQHARDWLGQTVAIFSCGDLGLSEWTVLPGELPELAVLADQPHVRPLLVARQRHPRYLAAVVDRRHAWVFRVAPERIDTVAELAGAGVRSHDFGGWYGLEAHRVNERVLQLARHHYRETAAILARAMRTGEPLPLVIGGHEESIGQFLATVPAELRERFAGSFAADPHAVTPARVRELAGPVIAHWLEVAEQRLAAQLQGDPPGGRTVTGLEACLVAVNSSAVQLLVVPDDGLVPGFGCGRCGALSSTGGDCPDGGSAVRAIPDLIEAMVGATISDGGQVEAVRDPPAGIGARLRFPLASGDKR